jgi:DNA-binding NarL/FixJ family response regulator
MEPTSVLIVEDHVLLREAWSFMVSQQKGLKEVASVGTGEEAVEKARQLRPDLILMDINLPGISGIEATEQILTCSPSSRVLAITMHSQPGYAKKIMQKGASGYVTKNSPREEFLKAIAEIGMGRKYVCEEIKNILSNQVISGEEDPNNLFSKLSERELQIIQLLKNGASSKEMAKALNISVKTIEVHRYNILRKLKLKNTAALVNYVNRYQLN